MQTDPIGYGDGINWYAYCGNNPTGFVDPSGLRASGCVCGRGCVWPNLSIIDVDSDPNFLMATGNFKIGMINFGIDAAIDDMLKAIATIEKAKDIYGKLKWGWGLIVGKGDLEWDPDGKDAVGKIAPVTGIVGKLADGAINGPAGPIVDYYSDILKGLLKVLKGLQYDGGWRAKIELQYWRAQRVTDIDAFLEENPGAMVNRELGVVATKIDDPFYVEVKFLVGWQSHGNYGYETAADAVNAALVGIKFWPCYNNGHEIPDQYRCDIGRELGGPASSPVYNYLSGGAFPRYGD